MPVLSMDPYGEPETLVKGATGPGVSSIQFGVMSSKVGGQRTLSLQMVPTGSFTGFMVNLESSGDGGATFQTVQSNIDLLSGPVIGIPVSPGFVYRLNVITFAGGTSAIVKGSCN
jgi:hypothetical protein